MAARKAGAPEERNTDTEKPVTELAHVDASTSVADMKDMSGATDKDASTQQQDALDGLKQAREDAKHPETAGERAEDRAHPFVLGPGGDIS